MNTTCSVQHPFVSFATWVLLVNVTFSTRWTLFPCDTTSSKLMRVYPEVPRWLPKRQVTLWPTSPPNCPWVKNSLKSKTLLQRPPTHASSPVWITASSRCHAGIW
eukprot:PhF_6_TR1961/c0_g1_i1/m.3192